MIPGSVRRTLLLVGALAALATPLAAQTPQQPPAQIPPPDPPGAAVIAPVELDAKPAEPPPVAMPWDKPLDLKPTFQLRGRIEAEAINAVQSQQSKQLLGNLMNGYGFRRVRLGAQGSISDSSSWVSEIEVSGSAIRLRDVFVGVDAVPGVRQVRVGFFREPYSLEGMTSSNFITLLERSPVNTIAPARNWGVCGFWWTDDERILFTTGAFRDGTPNSGQSIGDGNNWAYTTRLTGLPIYEDSGEEFRLLHLGGAVSLRKPPNGVINFSPRTSSTLLTVDDNPGSPFLPSVDLLASDYQLFNAQAAYVDGPFSVQTEWSAAMVSQASAGSIFVHGAYVLGSYFLTGEHRGYNRTRGSFDQVNVLRPFIRNRNDPRGGPGAIELTGRFSVFDFHSPNLPRDAAGAMQGTLLYELTVGTNWYLNTNTRLMFNYTAGIPFKQENTPTVAHLLGLRCAIFW